MKAHWAAARAPTLDGMDAAISAWEADQCNEALGQELSADEVSLGEKRELAAKGRVLAASQRFGVFQPVSASTPPKATVDTWWVFTWQM